MTRGHATRRRAAAGWIPVALAAMLAVPPATACPFCGVVGQSFAQRRDEAAIVAVGEAAGKAADAAGFPAQQFRIDQLLRGGTAPIAAGDTVAARVNAPVAGTAILFATASPAAGAAALHWSAVAADEALLGYVVAAPAVTLPATERLRWFAARLEHPDAVIAADSFTEFGLASFATVRTAAAAVDPQALREWLADPGIDQRRRGLYGLLLGAVADTTNDPAVGRECRAALRRAVEATGDDFRAGFDGVLAGLLVADGERGLEYLRGRGLFSPDARPLDQRHLLAALRFAAESLAGSIPRSQVAAATRLLLERPGVAADATIDLARYQAWDAVDDVARLWDACGRDDPLVRRAVAGYLAACPLPAAKRHLDAIGMREPALLRQALDAAALPAGR